MEELCDNIDSVYASTLNSILQCEGDPKPLSTGVTKFISRFDKLSAPSMCLKLASALHAPIWLGNGTATITQAGQIRHGKRIGVQATTVGRRRKVKSKGRQVPGWPSKGSLTSQKAAEVLAQSRHYLPIRNKPKGRTIHSLRTNIKTGQQNAGKWWLIQYLFSCTSLTLNVSYENIVVRKHEAVVINKFRKRAHYSSILNNKTISVLR